MILLDTNVLSEIMRPKPEPSVIAWLDEHTSEGFAISAVTRAEILLGLALMPKGKRRDNLTAQAHAMFDEDFADAIYSFDAQAAALYAELVATRSRQGLSTTTEDGQIAATALRYNCLLATRNTDDFAAIDGLRVLNPW
jgi:toxin FitB